MIIYTTTKNENDKNEKHDENDGMKLELFFNFVIFAMSPSIISIIIW
jgi:hypothetical protein